MRVRRVGQTIGQRDDVIRNLQGEDSLRTANATVTHSIHRRNQQRLQRQSFARRFAFASFEKFIEFGIAQFTFDEILKREEYGGVTNARLPVDCNDDCEHIPNKCVTWR